MQIRQSSDLNLLKLDLIIQTPLQLANLRKTLQTIDNSLGASEIMPRGKLGQHINNCEEQNRICQDPECPVKKVWKGNWGRAMFLCKLVAYKPICTEKSSCSRKVRALEVENESLKDKIKFQIHDIDI